MNFLLGFCPDGTANNQIRKTVGEVGKVFDDLGIPVRWSHPDTYNLSIISLGSSLPFYKNLWLRYKLKDFKGKSFKVTFNTIRLGISRKYKELIYLDLKEGGEDMRNMLYSLRKLLNIKDQGNFIPHLVLGRVSEDIGDQEYTNISKDLYRVSKQLNINDISFYVSDLKLIKNSSENFEILLEFGRSH